MNEKNYENEARAWAEMLATYATKEDYVKADDKIAYLMQFLRTDSTRHSFLQLSKDPTFRAKLEELLPTVI